MNEIRTRRHELHEESMALIDVEFKSGYNGPEYQAARSRQDAIEAERNALSAESDMLYAEWEEELKFHTEGFYRPTSRLIAPLNTRLGPLPKRMLVIQPTSEALAEVKSYRLLAFAVMLAAIASLFTLVTLFPWMAISPYILTSKALLALTGSELVAQIGPQVVFLVLILKGGLTIRNFPASGKFLDKRAMLEEQWFRAGAEAWTPGQRFYSCVAFGAVHVLNFIYPLASLLVVGMVLGGMALAVYLWEYRRSGDTRLATLASTKFHATYNRFAFTYLVVALGIVFGYPLVS
jgi:hypothetical protein